MTRSLPALEIEEEVLKVQGVGGVTVAPREGPSD